MQSQLLILVVEDETALVTLLRYNLEKEGYKVVDVGDGEEALASISERKPDLIILDWMLPSLSGIEVCRQIRRKPATRETPVIMLTARGEDQALFPARTDGTGARPVAPGTAVAAKRQSVLWRHYNGFVSPSRSSGRPANPSGADRIPPAAFFHAAPRQCLLA